MPPASEAAGDAPDAAAPPALRAILLGGAPIPPDLVRRATAAGWPVIPTYGLTEAGSGVTALPASESAATPGSAGRPLPGVMLRIAGPDPGGVGEIQVRTPAAFSGYLGREAESAAAFTADGWLRTGDLGRLDAEARLFVADRRDDLVVSGGENVYPAEVEAVLAAHPAIADAGVAGRPDSTWGAVPVAGIVLRPGALDPGDGALRAWCRERLAPAKVPGGVRPPLRPSADGLGQAAPRRTCASDSPRSSSSSTPRSPPAASSGRWPGPWPPPATCASSLPTGGGAGSAASTRRARWRWTSTSSTLPRSSTPRAWAAPSSWATASAASWPWRPPHGSRSALPRSSPTSRRTAPSPRRRSGRSSTSPRGRPLTAWPGTAAPARRAPSSSAWPGPGRGTPCPGGRGPSSRRRAAARSPMPAWPASSPTASGRSPARSRS